MKAKRTNLKQKTTCTRIYNDYKCWNSTGYCEYLKKQKKCPAYTEDKNEGNN